MIKIFITVGTTEFDKLIEVIDKTCGNHHELEIMAQISLSSVYKPVNIDYFEFSDRVESYIDDANIIITHAGAGSVYSMLEKGKKLIVVPNVSRIDHHQTELANYVEKHNFALTCHSLDDLCGLIFSVEQRTFDVYQKEDFFGVEIIRELLV
jgi:beta-1,4-N-acetylglucosaminyltransferase